MTEYNAIPYAKNLRYELYESFIKDSTISVEDFSTTHNYDPEDMYKFLEEMQDIFISDEIFKRAKEGYRTIRARFLNHLRYWIEEAIDYYYNTFEPWSDKLITKLEAIDLSSVYDDITKLRERQGLRHEKINVKDIEITSIDEEVLDS